MQRKSDRRADRIGAQTGAWDSCDRQSKKAVWTGSRSTRAEVACDAVSSRIVYYGPAFADLLATFSKKP
jgi:hypothetical protein